jgi:hypothetical protein
MPDVTEKTRTALEQLTKEKLRIPEDVYLGVELDAKGQICISISQQAGFNGPKDPNRASEPGQAAPPKKEILEAKEALLTAGLQLRLLTDDDIRTKLRPDGKLVGHEYVGDCYLSDHALFAFAEATGIKKEKAFQDFVREAALKEDPEKVKNAIKQMEWNKERVAEIHVAQFKGEKRPSVTIYFANEKGREAALATLKEEFKEEAEDVKLGKTTKDVRAKRPCFLSFPIKEGMTADQVDKIITTISNPTSNYYVPFLDYHEQLEKFALPAPKKGKSRNDQAPSGVVLPAFHVDMPPETGGHGLGGLTVGSRKTKSNILRSE